MKRRDVLKGAVGLGLAAATGCRVAQGPSLSGRILGASVQAGHRLRNPQFPAPSRQLKVDVAILGGGIAGLTAAWKLIRGGLHEVWLFELEGEVGGNSRAQVYPESQAPWAAHYLPVPTAESGAVAELLAEMGVGEDDLCHEPEERLFHAGRWEDGLFPRAGASSDDLRQLGEFLAHVEEWKRWRDPQGRKAFAIPVAASSSQLAALDRESMAAYLTRHGWTSPRLRWWVEYGTRDDYGTLLEYTSAWAGLHYFASRETDDQYVWPEGNARLARHLRAALGPRTSTGGLVFQAENRAGEARARVLDVTSGLVTEVVARHLIYALPSFTRPYVLGGERTPELSYAPWVVANLVLDGLPTELPSPHNRPLSWDNVIYASPSLGYVVATHQMLRTTDHPTVLTWYRPLTGEPAAERQAMLTRGWASWRDEVLGELGRVHPGIAGQARRLDVMLLGHAMIRPTPGLIWGETLPALRRPQGRIHFAHSDLSGLSIFEEAHYQGLRAAQEVLEELPGGGASPRRS